MTKEEDNIDTYLAKVWMRSSTSHFVHLLLVINIENSKLCMVANYHSLDLNTIPDCHRLPHIDGIGPKPFAAAQCALSTCCKTAVQIAYTACLQIGGLCWYPIEGTLSLLLGLYLGYICYLWIIIRLWVIIYCVYNFSEH